MSMEDTALSSDASSKGPPSTPKGARKAALAFILVTVALDMLALGMIAPVLPRLGTLFEGGNAVRATEIFGVFATVWALMQFLFSPVLGSLSDRFGRRPVILLSNFGLGLDYMIMAVAPNLSWLFAGRVLSGITAASVDQPGDYVIRARATDTKGRVQPESPEWNRLGYCNNAIQKLKITVH